MCFQKLTVCTVHRRFYYCTLRRKLLFPSGVMKRMGFGKAMLLAAVIDDLHGADGSRQSTLSLYTFVSSSKSNNLGICVMCRGIRHLAVSEGYPSDATVAGL